MDFVVIGGDAAGMSAASRAKRNQKDIHVTVLEMTEDVSYSACGMPYNIADPDRAMDDLVVRQAQVFRDKQGINLLTGHKVERIDPAARTVSGTIVGGDAFSFPYDKLLIATGASATVPDIPGVDLPGVFALKSLEDGRRIKDYIARNPVKKALIIGMGYIGLEMTEALRERNIDVEMLKPRPRLLPWMPETLSEVVREELEKHRVGLRFGCRLQGIEGEDGRLKAICSDGIVTADMILIAIGIRPNNDFAVDAGIETGLGDAIAVDRMLRTSVEDIYSAGDCADAYHVVTGKKAWIPLALRANRAGWAVADNVCGGSVALDGIAGTAVFKVLDLEVARTGFSIEEAKEAGFDPEEEVIKTRSRAHAHPGAQRLWAQVVGDKATGRLLGAQLVGKEGCAHRINAAAVALHAGMTVDEFFQCDLAYAPPFGPVWDPLLTAAKQLKKKL